VDTVIGADPQLIEQMYKKYNSPKQEVEEEGVGESNTDMVTSTDDRLTDEKEASSGEVVI